MEPAEYYPMLPFVYGVTASLLVALGLLAAVLTHHLLRKVLAINVMATGVFMLLGVLALQPHPAGSARSPAAPGDPARALGLAEGIAGSSATTGPVTGVGARLVVDPLPHALILTGIVVAFAASALAVGLIRLFHVRTGRARLPEEEETGRVSG